MYLKFCLLILALAAPLPAQTASAPETSASQPHAAQDTGPRSALFKLLTAVTTGDSKTVDEVILITDSKNKDVFLTELGGIIAEGRLKKAAHDVFGDRAGTLDLGMDEDDIAEARKEIAASTVKIEGDTAILAGRDGPTWYVVLKDKTWMLDWDKTAKELAPEPPPERFVARTRAWIKMIDDLTAQTVARKFATVDELEAAMTKLRGELQAAAATEPAFTSTKPQ